MIKAFLMSLSLCLAAIFNPFNPQIAAYFTASAAAFYGAIGALTTYNAAVVTYLPYKATNVARYADYLANPNMYTHQASVNAYNAAGPYYTAVQSKYGMAVTAYGDAATKRATADAYYCAHGDDSTPPPTPEQDPGPLPTDDPTIVYPPLPPSGPVGPG